MIRDGDADGSGALQRGGGVYVSGSGTEVSLANTVIRSNGSGSHGAGIAIESLADVTLQGCTVKNKVISPSLAPNRRGI
jgi:hypothetical protein